LRFIGPGILVTVGFIDPGNWASNVAAGSQYGYELLWMVTLSTIMLILLQHNAAHLGIVTGRCISEAASEYLPRWFSKPVLVSAVLASVSTALAELLGGAIALGMLFGIPIKIGSTLVTVFVLWALFTNSYRKLEKIIIAFVSIIGLGFLFEIFLVPVEWGSAAVGWVVPRMPPGAMVVVMSVLGAVVMPHNLFLHSEIIQSRGLNTAGEEAMEKQLKFEFLDTLLSMGIGWAINSAMILVAAAAFFGSGVEVTELEQAADMLTPMVGRAGSLVFAIALLFAGLSSSVTAGMAGGSIFAGVFGESYDIKDRHSRVGVGVTIVGALICIFFITDPFSGLVWSQVALSIQLPFTILTQVMLTSSRRVMGAHANTRSEKITLWGTGVIVAVLNVMLLVSMALG
jgi:manganese transport protein